MGKPSHCYHQVDKVLIDLWPLGTKSASLYEKETAAVYYLCVGIFLLERGGWLVQKALDVSPLQDLIIFLCFAELHVYFRSPAPKLLKEPTPRNISTAYD